MHALTWASVHRGQNGMTMKDYLSAEPEHHFNRYVAAAIPAMAVQNHADAGLLVDAFYMPAQMPPRGNPTWQLPIPWRAIGVVMC